MNVVTQRREILLALFGIVLITANVNIASSLCSQILSQDYKEHVMTLKIVSFKYLGEFLSFSLYDFCFFYFQT